MAAILPTVLALVAAGLMALALWMMTVGDLTAAGMSFLSASLVLYLRETRRTGE